MTAAGSAGLAIAVLAEHVTTGSPLPDIVARLGVVDRAELGTAVCEVESAAILLRDLIAPRQTDSAASTDDAKQAPPHTSVINKWRGKCECGRHVPEGRGRAVRIATNVGRKPGNGWQLFCYPCADEKGYA